jgi:ribose/xylose/arabinose/galactoside ABC-type transport system permease subunit
MEADIIQIGGRRFALKAILEKYGIYIFLIILFVFASLVSPVFLRPRNLQDILYQASALGIVSLGQTFVILGGRGGLDLSVASVMATVAVIIAHNTQGNNALLPPVFLVCVCFGVMVGLANGLLVTKRRVPPFMATLGMMIIIQGLRFIYTKGAPKGDFPPFVRFLGRGNVGLIPVSVLSLAFLTILSVIILRKTLYGRTLYAVGGNINTAYLSGYNADLIIIATYMISGLTAVIGGVYLAGWIGISDNWVGKGYELDSIAAVVMGGTSFEGGQGGVLGTIAGVLIITMLYNLILLLHLPIQVQYIVKGAVIILAAAFYVRRSLT